MSKPNLFLVNPTEALGKVKGIFSAHIKTLANYVATTKVEAATSGVFSTENFTFKVLLPAAALYAGQEILINAMQISNSDTLKHVIADNGFADGLVKYVQEHAFQHSNLLRNGQDLSITAIVAGIALKISQYGFNKATLKIAGIQDAVFKQIATQIYYKYSELVEDPRYSELSAFKEAYDHSSTVIENLNLEPEQKTKLLAVISNKMTRAVEFHKELEMQRG